MGAQRLWRRRVRRTAAALAIVGLSVAGCSRDTAGEPTGTTLAAPTSTTVPPAAPPTSPPCPASGAQLTLGVADGAMGLRLLNFVLTNCGTQPYILSGYPEVALLDDDRQPFAVEVLHGPEPITPNEGYCTPSGLFDAGPQPVTLAPGETAHAGMVWRNLTTDELDDLVNAPLLAVTPAAGEAPQELVPDGPVDLGTTGRFGVSAWHAAGTSC